MSRRSIPVTDLAAVAAGGVAGAALRHRLTRANSVFAELAANSVATQFPLDVLVVNCAGCLAIGWLIHSGRHERPTPRWRRAAIVGFCGSLTTLSTFAADLALLFGAGSASPSLPTACVYLLTSVAGGAAAFIAGRSLARGSLRPKPHVTT